MTDDMISVTQVAELARERPNTISTWRGRYADFPVGTRRGRQVLFSRDEVVQWLERHRPGWSSEFDLEGPRGDALHHVSRSADAADVGLSLICLAVLAPDDLADALHNDGEIGPLSLRVETRVDRSGLLAPLRHPDAAIILPDALALVSGTPESVRPVDELQAAFEMLLSERARTSSTRRSVFRSPGWLAELMFDLVSDAVACEGVLLDPAAGEGGFLLAAARRSSAPLHLRGWELDGGSARLARQRMLVHGFDAVIDQADSLGVDGLDVAGASAVICDPPLALRVDGSQWRADDPRWRDYALPESYADLGWILLAVHHLLPGGRAAVLTSRGALTRPRNDGIIRRRLLQAGQVEAVIALPGGSVLQTGVPLALWLLRKTDDGPSDEVLFLDASDAQVGRRAPVQDAPERAAYALADRIRAVVEDWRRDPAGARLPPGFAAGHIAASVAASDVDLDPQRLVHVPATREEVAAELNLVQARRAALLSKLSALSPQSPLGRSGESTLGHATIGQLLSARRLELVGGQRTGATIEGDGVRVLGSWTFRDGAPRRSPTATPVLRAGDVLVGPRQRGFQARVARQDEDGAALESPVQAIRIVASGAETEATLTPSLLAELINMSPDASGTAGRQTVKTIAIPLLTWEAADALDGALAVLRHESKLTRELDAVRERIRRLLAEQLAR